MQTSLHYISPYKRTVPTLENVCISWMGIMTFAQGLISNENIFFFFVKSFKNYVPINYVLYGNSKSHVKNPQFHRVRSVHL